MNVRGWVNSRRTATGLDGEVALIGSAHFGITVLVVGLLTLAACYAGGRYIQTVVSIGCAYIVSALGYNLVLGYARQMAFGHAGLMAAGAYTFAILQAHKVIGVVAFVSAVFVAALLAFIVGVGVLRTRHLYLGIVTLAFAEAVIVVLNVWPETHGENGISASLLGHDEYYLAIGVTIVSLVLADRLVRSRFGRAMLMVSQEGPAAAMGVSVSGTRVFAFVCSGIFAGAGGVLMATALLYITPSDFSSELTLLLLTMIVIGGLASVWGTVIGAGLLTALPQVLSMSLQLQAVLYGAALFLVLVFRPRGLVSTMELLGLQRHRR